MILAIDRSGSMLATDVSPTRMAAARAAATTFIRGTAVGIQGRARLVLGSGGRRAPADVGPRAGGEGADDAAGRQRNRPRRRDHPLRRSRADEPGHEAPRPRARRSSCCCSRTARTRPVMRRRSKLRRARAQKKVPVYTVALGTDAGTITTTSADWRDPPLPRPAGPGDARRGRREDRREVLPGCRRRVAPQRLQQDRLAGRHRGPAARADGSVCRGGRRSPPCQLRPVPRLVQPAAVSPLVRSSRKQHRGETPHDSDHHVVGCPATSSSGRTLRETPRGADRARGAELRTGPVRAPRPFVTVRRKGRWLRLVVAPGKAASVRGASGLLPSAPSRVRRRRPPGAGFQQPTRERRYA